MPQLYSVCDVPEFLIWKQELQLELQDIFDRTSDKFIGSVLVILKQGFNSYNDKTVFNELSGSLLAIRKNINKYYDETEKNLPVKFTKNKIFISHSTNNKDVALTLVELFTSIGLNEHQIFCSSAIGFGIPLNEDIYEYLKQQFQDYNLHVIFVLSDYYYGSTACMNEMGAAWVLQSEYTSILLPHFNFKDIGGAINPRKISIKLDNDIVEVKEKLGQLKNNIIEKFELAPLTDVRWEEKRDKFLSSVNDC